MGKENTQSLHILTFDLEEWFYIYSAKVQFDAAQNWQINELRAEPIVLKILALLKQYHACATFFCMGEFARKYPSLVKRIADEGHELGAHSDKHQYAYFQDMPTFEADLKENIYTLERLTGKRILSYRTPAYSIDTLQERYQQALSRQGIKYDSSVKAGLKSVIGKVVNRPLNLGHERLFFPVSTLTLVPQWPYAGSGFFRLMPQWLVEQKLNRPGYHMLYFHPRDFDPAMWRLPHELTLRIKYGLGTERMFKRLELLLKKYKMVSIEKAIQFPHFKQILLQPDVA